MKQLPFSDTYQPRHQALPNPSDSRATLVIVEFGMEQSPPLPPSVEPGKGQPTMLPMAPSPCSKDKAGFAMGLFGRCGLIGSPDVDPVPDFRSEPGPQPPPVTAEVPFWMDPANPCFGLDPYLLVKAMAGSVPDVAKPKKADEEQSEDWIFDDLEDDWNDEDEEESGNAPVHSSGDDTADSGQQPSNVPPGGSGTDSGRRHSRGRSDGPIAGLVPCGKEKDQLARAQWVRKLCSAGLGVPGKDHPCKNDYDWLLRSCVPVPEGKKELCDIWAKKMISCFKVYPLPPEDKGSAGCKTESQSVKEAREAFERCWGTHAPKPSGSKRYADSESVLNDCLAWLISALIDCLVGDVGDIGAESQCWSLAPRDCPPGEGCSDRWICECRDRSSGTACTYLRHPTGIAVVSCDNMVSDEVTLGECPPECRNQKVAQGPSELEAPVDCGGCKPRPSSLTIVEMCASTRSTEVFNKLGCGVIDPVPFLGMIALEPDLLGGPLDSDPIAILSADPTPGYGGA